MSLSASSGATHNVRRCHGCDGGSRGIHGKWVVLPRSVEVDLIIVGGCRFINPLIGLKNLVIIEWYAGFGVRLLIEVVFGSGVVVFYAIITA